jgi:Na+-transporting methylmalonyl-CoA/oxaloacetate decarboxylase beta subunit
MNLFLRGKDKLNPLIGAAGVSAVPDSARVVHNMGLKDDPSNFLLMHAMAPMSRVLLVLLLLPVYY